MTRFNQARELFESISDIGVFRDTSGGGSSTIAATLPAVDTLDVINAVSGTGFIASDYYRLRALTNAPEIGQVASISTNAITPKYRLGQAVIVGDTIVEQSQVSLAHIADEGVSVAFTARDDEVRAANRALMLTYLPGHVSLRVSFSVLATVLENWATSLGILDTTANLLGSQTAADPTRLFVNGANMREENLLSWYVTGRRKDGRTQILHLWGCELIPAGIRTLLARGSKGTIQMTLAPTSGARLIEYD